jgi:polyhydroxyalkanoate synthesis regulator phasin
MKKNDEQLKMKNLGMIKMHPGTIRELRRMYEEYEKSLPEGEPKLDKGEFFGQHYEKVISAYSDLYAKHKLQQAQLENAQSAYQAAEDIEGGEQERSQADLEEEEINILHRQIRKLEKRLDKAQNGGEINWYSIGAAGVAILFAIGAVYIALQIRKKVKNDE